MLSDVALDLQRKKMAASPAEGDSVRAAEEIKATLLASELGKAYQWLCERLLFDYHRIKGWPNPIFTEIEVIRVSRSGR